MAKKTRKMRQIEVRFGKPLEYLLCDRLNEVGHTETCRELGVPRATLGYWILKLGIVRRYTVSGR